MKNEMKKQKKLHRTLDTFTIRTSLSIEHYRNVCES